MVSSAGENDLGEQRFSRCYLTGIFIIQQSFLFKYILIFAVLIGFASLQSSCYLNLDLFSEGWQTLGSKKKLNIKKQTGSGFKIKSINTLQNRSLALSKLRSCIIIMLDMALSKLSLAPQSFQNPRQIALNFMRKMFISELHQCLERHIKLVELCSCQADRV